MKALRYADVAAEHAMRGFFGVTMPQREAEERARVLMAMRARVTSRRYPGKPHPVSAERLSWPGNWLARQLVEGAFA